MNYQYTVGTFPVQIFMGLAPTLMGKTPPQDTRYHETKIYLIYINETIQGDHPKGRGNTVNTRW